MRPLLALFLFVGGALHGATTLEWRDATLVASNGQITRRWALEQGLPKAISLAAEGEEWLRPAVQPTTLLPDNFRLVAPLQIEWKSAEGRENAAEIFSHRGTLTVIGADGRGYRWHIKIFDDCPAVTCRIELVGRWSPADPKLSGDVMESFELAPLHANLVVADLSDVTDTHDNLAGERTWRLTARERISAATNLCAIENPLTGKGLIVLKHSPLPGNRPVPSSVDVIGEYPRVTICGHGMGDDGQGYAWSVLSYSGGAWGRAAALHKLQSCLREFRPERDGLMMSNTWGDRNRDARIQDAFIRAELAAGKDLGIDVCEIDDGWQKGLSANSALKTGGAWGQGYWASDRAFWDPRPGRFPQGLGPLAEVAAKARMSLGLWFSPDAAQDYAAWRKDADTVIGFRRNWGVTHVKIDGMKIATKEAEKNFHRFVSAVIDETQGSVAFDLDVTSGVRPGYFGLMEAGIFLENRYSDWRSWWPHATLRNLWQLSWYVAPQRLRIEFLNSDRNQDKYRGDPLAPANYPSDYACATTLVANPLAWFETSQLPPDRGQPIKQLVAIWKKYREELQTGNILPIGDCPSGAAWTGFCSVGDRTAQVLAFRELTVDNATALRLPLAGDWKVQTLAGEGAATMKDGRLLVQMPHPLHYLWLRLTR